MTAAPRLTVLERGHSAGPFLTAGAPSQPDARTFGKVNTVEIVAPDQYCATLLLDHAAPLFPAEIVPGPGWIVRFQPPPTSRDWVTELLTLIEAWLPTAPLPCAKVRHGDHEYLIRAPSNFDPPAPTAWDAA